MPIACTARITLEVKVGVDPIRGSIDHADGWRQPFWGWLELIEELRRVAAGEPEQPSRPSRVHPRPVPEPDARTQATQLPTTTEEQP